MIETSPVALDRRYDYVGQLVSPDWRGVAAQERAYLARLRRRRLRQPASLNRLNGPRSNAGVFDFPVSPIVRRRAGRAVLDSKEDTGVVIQIATPPITLSSDVGVLPTEVASVERVGEHGHHFHHPLADGQRYPPASPCHPIRPSSPVVPSRPRRLRRIGARHAVAERAAWPLPYRPTLS